MENVIPLDGFFYIVLAGGARYAQGLNPYYYEKGGYPPENGVRKVYWTSSLRMARQFPSQATARQWGEQHLPHGEWEVVQRTREELDKEKA